MIFLTLLVLCKEINVAQSNGLRSSSCAGTSITIASVSLAAAMAILSAFELFLSFSVIAGSMDSCGCIDSARKDGCLTDCKNDSVDSCFACLNVEGNVDGCSSCCMDGRPARCKLGWPLECVVICSDGSLADFKSDRNDGDAEPWHDRGKDRPLNCIDGCGCEVVYGRFMIEGCCDDW